MLVRCSNGFGRIQALFHHLTTTSVTVNAIFTIDWQNHKIHLSEDNFTWISCLFFFDEFIFSPGPKIIMHFLRRWAIQRSVANWSFSQQPCWDLVVGEAQVLLITLTMALFHLCPLSHDSVTVSQHALSQDHETEKPGKEVCPLKTNKGSLSQKASQTTVNSTCHSQ